MQSLLIARRAAAILVALPTAILLTPLALPAANAQVPTAAPAASSGAAQTGKTSASKSANVKNGEIAAFDAAGDALTLRDHAGKSAVYVVTPKTHYNRNRRVAQRTDFKTGDLVVLHFRRSRTDGALLVSELDDPASWTWISALRKSTTAAIPSRRSRTTRSP